MCSSEPGAAVAWYFLSAVQMYYVKIASCKSMKCSDQIVFDKQKYL